MKFSKKFSHRNLDAMFGIFKLILLIYGEKKDKNLCVKTYVG